jgi:hypothetical protein
MPDSRALDAIFLSIATYAIQIFEWMNIRKSAIGGKLLPSREDVQGVLNNKPVESLRMVTETPPLDLQIAIKVMKIQQNIDANRYGEILQGRELEK